MVGRTTAATAATEAPPGAAAVELVLGFASDAHDAGYPTADLDERLLAFARSLGLAGTAVSATPTLVDVALGSLEDQRTYSLRLLVSTIILPRRISRLSPA